MIPNDVVPGNTAEPIWKIIERCQFSEKEEQELKGYVENKGMIFLSTPFSREAANRLKRMNVSAIKIGSGECNNYPLLEHIADMNKPVILSTGMNDLTSVKRSVEIFKNARVSYALLHCTSMYPTPYNQVRLGGIDALRKEFPDTVLGLSDHSLGNYTAFAAIALGASIVEKHFTSDKSWSGPDIPISIDPSELKDLIKGSLAIHEASGGTKDILKGEEPTIRFAYASVVSIKDIQAGEVLSRENIWVKRPGTGEIGAGDFHRVLGKTAACNIGNNSQLGWADVREITGENQGKKVL